MKSVQCVMEENDIVSAFIKADTLDWLFIDADKMKHAVDYHKLVYSPKQLLQRS